MAFWDRFVLWVYLGMADTTPVPRAAAARIFEEALQRGQLQIASLNDLSVLLLLACASANSRLRLAAQAEVLRRKIPAQPEGISKLLRAMTPRRLVDLLEVGRAPVPQLRGLVLGILLDSVVSPVLINLCHFLGRVYLTDPEGEISHAVHFIYDALASYYRIPQGTLDFPARLYRHVLFEAMTRPERLPRTWTSGVHPNWVAIMDPAEIGMLDRILARVTPEKRLLLALQMYARLNVEQIASVLQASNQTWTADQVALDLEQCWKDVL